MCMHIYLHTYLSTHKPVIIIKYFLHFKKYILNVLFKHIPILTVEGKKCLCTQKNTREVRKVTLASIFKKKETFSLSSSWNAWDGCSFKLVILYCLMSQALPLSLRTYVLLIPDPSPLTLGTTTGPWNSSLQEMSLVLYNSLSVLYPDSHWDYVYLGHSPSTLILSTVSKSGRPISQKKQYALHIGKRASMWTCLKLCSTHGAELNVNQNFFLKFCYT